MLRQRGKLLGYRSSSLQGCVVHVDVVHVDIDVDVVHVDIDVDVVDVAGDVVDVDVLFCR